MTLREQQSLGRHNLQEMLVRHACTSNILTKLSGAEKAQCIGASAVLSPPRCRMLTILVLSGLLRAELHCTDTRACD